MSGALNRGSLPPVLHFHACKRSAAALLRALSSDIGWHARIVSEGCQNKHAVPRVIGLGQARRI